MAGTRAVAAGLLAALALAACGEKPEPDLSKIPPPRATAAGTAAAQERPELTITAEGDREAIRYRVTGEPEAGPVRVTLRNQSPRPTTGRMVRAERELSPADLTAELDRLPAVGPPRTEPGKSSTVSLELQPGTYYVVGDQPVADRPASFRVAP